MPWLLLPHPPRWRRRRSCRCGLLPPPAVAGLAHCGRRGRCQRCAVSRRRHLGHPHPMLRSPHHRLHNKVPRIITKARHMFEVAAQVLHQEQPDIATNGTQGGALEAQYVSQVPITWCWLVFCPLLVMKADSWLTCGRAALSDGPVPSAGLGLAPHTDLHSCLVCQMYCLLACCRHSLPSSQGLHDDAPGVDTLLSCSAAGAIPGAEAAPPASSCKLAPGGERPPVAALDCTSSSSPGSAWYRCTWITSLGHSGL